MKHRRGIDLGRPEKGGVTYLGPLQEPAYKTFQDIPEWQALGGRCPKCEREAWVSRWELQRKWGERTYLGTLASRLRCLGCDNKVGNRWITGQLPR